LNNVEVFRFGEQMGRMWVWPAICGW